MIREWQEAFILHQRPYGNTSVIAEVFTRNYGRVSVLARGAKNPKSKLNRKVIGIDIDIRKHNKEKIEKHFLADKIEMIEASSVDIKTFKKVEKISKNYSKILVILDSNHTEEHVLQELTLYGSLVSKNSYCIVFDTIISEMAPEFSSNRPWNKCNSPKTAINKFLKKEDKFIVDKSIDNKLLISMAPGGFLKKVK